MTPSNPDNQQSLIYRIADALGVFHLVAPVNHTHTYAEIPGLADELNELWAGVNEKASQEDVTEALAGKQNILTFDSTPTSGSTNPVTSGGVKAALASKANASDVQTALAAKMANTALSIEVEYHMSSHQVKYYDGASSIFSSVPEKKIAVAMLYFFSNEGHNPLGNTLVQLRWYNSVNNIYKYIEIFINGAVYNLRYKVETEEWREMVQTSASITQYLPTSAE